MPLDLYILALCCRGRSQECSHAGAARFLLTGPPDHFPPDSRHGDRRAGCPAGLAPPVQVRVELCTIPCTPRTTHNARGSSAPGNLHAMSRRRRSRADKGAWAAHAFLLADGYKLVAAGPAAEDDTKGAPPPLPPLRPAPLPRALTGQPLNQPSRPAPQTGRGTCPRRGPRAGMACRTPTPSATRTPRLAAGRRST